METFPLFFIVGVLAQSVDAGWIAKRAPARLPT
jgi:hypothetical protein